MNQTKFERLAALLCALLLCTSAATALAEAAAPTGLTGALARLSASTPADANAELARHVLEGMTLEEKIGQLFIVRPEALCLNAAENSPDYSRTQVTQAMRAGLAACPVGGVALFGQNLESPEQLKSFLDELQAGSRVPLFIAVDEEGGSVARLANSGKFGVPKLGAMEDVGASGDPANAREAYRIIGGYLAPYGVNLDFAPVADVNTNPQNRVIGRRAFGSDPERVAEMVRAALEGLHSVGVMGCVKHFPGHGDTTGDTHEGGVRVNKTWSELLDCELVPFIAALESADLVMAAHISAPNVTGNDLPASLSPELLQGKLRGELGYQGAIITDALEMGAVTQRYSSGQAAVLALEAGADILLMPASLSGAMKGVREAIESGKISESRLNESVLRILTLKARYGLLQK